MTIQKAHMIQRSSTSVENYTMMPAEKIPARELPETPRPEWKQQLIQSRINTRALLDYLELDSHPLADSEAEQLFELRVPESYLRKIKKGDPNDPLLLQILPQTAEHTQISGFSVNPLDEHQFTPVKGVLHKYTNRVLLITSAACAINCRYCFRRNFPYAEHRQSRADWQAALAYIRRTTELDEVILSGGDPLTQTNHWLAWLLGELDAIPHISRIRIHTRLLSALPERIDDELLLILSKLTSDTVIVSHCNHPNELGEELRPALSSLKQAGVTLLNQAVLLRQINNDADTLTTLSKELFKLGILPYYLFLLDPVAGAAHFNVSEQEARGIFSQLQSRLPGYLVPRLAREIPGKPAKTLIHSN
jgi:EF-P beta-lysylation protein EpmB